MENFNRKSIKSENISGTDTGVQISELIKIVESNELSRKIFKELNIDKIKNEFINIKGSQTLVNIQREYAQKFHKEDLKSELKDVTFYEKGLFTINFNNIVNNEYFHEIKINEISTIPIYSASRDFFSNLFNMDKYANSLIKLNHKSILESNLKLIKKVKKIEKKYRLLHEKNTNKFYLRAIISTGSYNNYDNNLAVVIGLISLHNEMKKSSIIYSLERCEYNESFIRMFFESSESKELENIGRVKNIVEISNDEIKREALRFSGICKIEYGNKKNINGSLFIRPSEINSKILSISHIRTPKNAIKELQNMSDSEKIHLSLFEDISRISKIKKPDQIKFLVKNKIEKATSEDIKKLKPSLLKELNKNADSIITLLNIFNKIQLLADEDIDATEYLRYVIYCALIEHR